MRHFRADSAPELAASSSGVERRLATKQHQPTNHKKLRRLHPVREIGQYLIVLANENCRYSLVIAGQLKQLEYRLVLTDQQLDHLLVLGLTLWHRLVLADQQLDHLLVLV